MDTLEQTPLEEPQATEQEPKEMEPIAQEEPVAKEQAPAAEEPVAEEPVAEEPAAEEEGISVPLMMTKQEVMARVSAIVENGETSDKQELDLLKQLYYKYHNAEAM
ncbi:MAG: hypothetical protein LUC33_01820, partial [Prevotellaceae bacterium]|nr:hypothetical protein [Prevotellaceae bacterium]